MRSRNLNARISREKWPSFRNEIGKGRTRKKAGRHLRANLTVQVVDAGKFRIPEYKGRGETG
jgi:hypothetical protein